jgi:phosphate transport system substrate-binding protein
VNDEFLHRLRQQPPPVFAARLRAQLESQAVVRRSRTRQITVYALIGCLLGGTAWALVSPAVRMDTVAMLQQIMPEALVNTFHERSRQTADRHAGEVVQPLGTRSITPVSRPAPAPNDNPPAPAGIFATAHSKARMTDAAGGFTAGGSQVVAVTTPSMPQAAAPAAVRVKIEGAQVAASVISLAVEPFAERPFAERPVQQRPVRIELRGSSSERGIQKLCAGEIDVALTTRPILPAEVQACRAGNVVFAELPIAYEALVVLVNSSNDWADAISLQNLRVLFDPASQGSTAVWNELQPRWPAAPVALAAVRPGQGFQESFGEIVLGSVSANRQDIRLERDEFGLLRHVQRWFTGLTYLPFASYLKSDPQGMRARPLAIVNSRGVAVLPSKASIADGSYEPLSRLLLIYVKASSEDRWAREFVQFFLSKADTLVASSRYLPLEPTEYRLADRVLREGLTGTISESDGTVPVTTRQILMRYFPKPKFTQESTRSDADKRR